MNEQRSHYRTQFRTDIASSQCKRIKSFLKIVVRQQPIHICTSVISEVKWPFVLSNNLQYRNIREFKQMVHEDGQWTLSSPSNEVINIWSYRSASFHAQGFALFRLNLLGTLAMVKHFSLLQQSLKAT